MSRREKFSMVAVAILFLGTLFCLYKVPASSGESRLPAQRLGVHLADHEWAHPPKLERSERAKLLRMIASHDRWVIQTAKQHTAKAVAFHRVELGHAKTKLAQIAAKNLMLGCHSGACIVSLIRRIWVEDPEGAVTVAWCESNHTTFNRTGQYVGIFQLGTGERSRYGHVGSGLYASPDGGTAASAPAWEQVVAAHHYYKVDGWYPWECLPTGGLRW